ncbi:MAG TPA: hypothetical protein VKR06_00215 [Ktedonosporobacter sp.]|nr:hypothetical protein [Ktedonosporobacter sp.]
MLADESKSMICIYCNAPQTENTPICATCEALASLMGHTWKGSCEKEHIVSPPVQLSQRAQPADQPAAPPSVPATWGRRLSLPSHAKSTAPGATVYPWPRFSLPMREKKSQISWVQTYARQSQFWWMPTPSPSQSAPSLDERDAAAFPTLPLLSLSSLPLPSKSGIAPSPASALSPNKDRFSRTMRETFASSDPVAQDLLLLSRLPRTLEHELLLLSAPPLPSRSSRSSSPKVGEQADLSWDQLLEATDTLPLKATTGGKQPPPAAREHLHVPVMYTKPRAIIPTYRAISGLLSLLILFAALSVGVVYDASASGSLAALQRLINNAPDPRTLSTTVLPTWNSIDKGPTYDTIPFAQTASRIDPDLAIALQPDKLFHAGQIFYVTYSVQYPKTAGKVTIKWYVDNALVQSLNSPTLPPARISNGYAAILYTSSSVGAVELYWNDQLAQRLYFTVK